MAELKIDLEDYAEACRRGIAVLWRERYRGDHLLDRDWEHIWKIYRSKPGMCGWISEINAIIEACRSLGPVRRSLASPASFAPPPSANEVAKAMMVAACRVVLPTYDMSSSLEKVEAQRHVIPIIAAALAASPQRQEAARAPDLLVEGCAAQLQVFYHQENGGQPPRWDKVNDKHREQFRKKARALPRLTAEGDLGARYSAAMDGEP